MNSSLSNLGRSFSHSALVGGPILGGCLRSCVSFTLSIPRNMAPAFLVYNVKPADEPRITIAIPNCSAVGPSPDLLLGARCSDVGAVVDDEASDMVAVCHSWLFVLPSSRSIV